MNADTDETALTNAWPYPAETDAIDELLRIRPAGRVWQHMAFGMASEYAAAALFVAFTV